MTLGIQIGPNTIKVYARSCWSGRADDILSADAEIRKIKDANIVDKRQQFEHIIVPTKRKRKPIDWECSFYSMNTLKQFDEDSKSFARSGA